MAEALKTDLATSESDEADGAFLLQQVYDEPLDLERYVLDLSDYTVLV